MTRPAVYSLITVLALLIVAGIGLAVWPPRDDGAPQPAAGVFAQLPVGAVLPSGAECAGRVQTSPWEPVPDNFEANHRRPGEVALADFGDYDEVWNETYKTRIDGDYVGTTDEIIQWAACKWGLSAELLRAQAVAESEWEQAAEGDDEPSARGNCTPGDDRDPCPTSFGLLQNKWYFNEVAYPWLRTMSAFHMDWSAAKLRGCLDGHKSGLPAGDMDGCLGNWFSGGWQDDAGREYVGRVRGHLEDRTWLEWPDRSGSVAYLPYSP